MWGCNEQSEEAISGWLPQLSTANMISIRMCSCRFSNSALNPLHRSEADGLEAHLLVQVYVMLPTMQAGAC